MRVSEEMEGLSVRVVIVTLGIKREEGKEIVLGFPFLFFGPAPRPQRSPAIDFANVLPQWHVVLFVLFSCNPYALLRPLRLPLVFPIPATITTNTTTTTSKKVRRKLGLYRRDGWHQCRCPGSVAIGRE